MSLLLGTRVTFDDGVPLTDKPSDLVGVISEPTLNEVRYGQTYDPPSSPANGDVVVAWGCCFWNRTWQRPDDLIVIDGRTAGSGEPDPAERKAAGTP
jgi:hypothetical protein